MDDRAASQAEIKSAFSTLSTQRLIALLLVILAGLSILTSALLSYEEVQTPHPGASWKHGRTWYGVQYSEYVSDQPHQAGVKACRRQRLTPFNDPGRPARAALFACPWGNSSWYADK